MDGRSGLAERKGAFFSVAPDDETRAKQEYLPQIQKLAARTVTPDDVHVRGMRIINSARDFYYSRFAGGALEEVASLLPGRPVMAGHKYDTLPLGTFFAAKKTYKQATPKAPRRDSYWVEALFYVPKDEAGDNIVRRIDLGTYREVSLGWRFLDATCSVCDSSIFGCDHVPGEIYDRGICEYEMSGITDVLEGSLVFAGGQKGTHLFSGTAMRSLDELQADSSLIVTPADLIRGKHARANKSTQGLRRNVAAVMGSTDRFDTQDEAARWVREHSFRADKPSVADGGFRFDQFAVNDAEVELRVVKLDDGVSGIVVQDKVQPAERSGGESLESWFNTGQ